MCDDEHVHVLGAKNGWVDCSTLLLLLVTGKPSREGRVCGAKRVKTKLSHYYKHMQAKSEEKLT